MRSTLESTPSIFRLRGDVINARRYELGLRTDQALADYIGMHRSAVYRVLHGTSQPGPKIVAAMVTAFDCSIDDLFEVVDIDEGSAA